MVNMMVIYDNYLNPIGILSNQGLNPMSPFFEDKFIQELDTGADTLEFKTLNNNYTSNKLKVGNYVGFKFQGKVKLFQILEVTDTHEGENKEIEIYGEIVGLELLNDYSDTFTIEGNAKLFFDTILADTRWRLRYMSSTLENNIQKIEYKEMKSVYTIIQENLEVFGGLEIEFSVGYSGNRITGFYIDVYANGERGRLTEKRFTFNESMKLLQRKYSFDKFCTAVVAEGKNGVTIKDVEWKKSDGKPTNKPAGSMYLVDEDANQLYNRNGNYIVGKYSNNECESKETLCEEAWNYLQENKEPRVEYKCDVALVTEQYEDLYIGDTNYIIDYEWVPRIYLSCRVRVLEISFTNPSQNKVTFSNFKELTSRIRANQIDIDEEVIQGIIDRNFPINSDKILDGAITNGKIDPAYVEVITADAVDASIVITETLIAENVAILDAKIDNLDVATLTSDMAIIKNLVGGNITMENIGSLILTSKKVTVEDAFIKNAMIDSVSAAKINTGILNTNLVNIQSEDGSLTLNGTLQQFKDENGKVRIQMGKDAQGHFTFGIFDATGTGTLINSNGITEKAIGDGLIVNSMVNENANISGGKLDIDSVVTEVNNGTSTIKSNKILFDEKNQTLDIAFNQMDSKVTTQGQTIGTHTTQIQAAQGNIQTLIAETTIIEDGNKVAINDAYSKINESVGQISLSVKDVESNFNNMKIGAKNLIANSAPTSLTDWRIANGTYWSTSLVDCVSAPIGKAIRATCSAKSSGGIYKFAINKAKLINGEIYTMSAWIRSSKLCTMSFYNELMTKSTLINVTTEWKLYTHTSVIDTSKSQWANVFYVTNDTSEAGLWYEVHSLMFENSTKNSNWGEPPERIADNMNALDTRVKSAEVKLTKDGLTTTIGDSYVTPEKLDGKGYATKLEVTQTVDNFSLKFSESGGYNLLYNGNFQNGMSFWSNVGSNTLITDSSCPANQTSVRILGELGVTKQMYQAVENIKYLGDLTLSYWSYVSTTGASGTTNPFLAAQMMVEYTDGTKTYPAVSHDTDYGIWKRRTLTIPSNGKRIKSIYLGIYNRDTTRILYISDVIVTKGNVQVPYAPNSNEIYDGIVTIDKDGIKVDSSDVSAHTIMGKNGFEIVDEIKNRKIFSVKNNRTLDMVGTVTVYDNDGNKSGYLGHNSLDMYNWITGKEEVAATFSMIRDNDTGAQRAGVFGKHSFTLGKISETGVLKSIIECTATPTVHYYADIVMNGQDVNKVGNITTDGINKAKGGTTLYINQLHFRNNAVNTNYNSNNLYLNYWKGYNATTSSTTVKVCDGGNDGTYGDLKCGDFKAYGAKNCIVETDYGHLGINAYETAECYFGDIGETVLDDEGYSYVYIDSIFAQTVNTNRKYQVFLTVYNDGIANVIERHPTHFVIKGTPGIETGYEIKAKRKGYEDNRLEREANSWVKGQEHGLDEDYKAEKETFTYEIEEKINETNEKIFKAEDLLYSINSYKNNLFKSQEDLKNNVQFYANDQIKNKKLLNIVEESILNESIN